MKPTHGQGANPDSSSGGDSKGAKISRREIEIIRQIALGFASKQIAANLHIALTTVENHRTNIYRKLHFRCVADLVRYAIREGIIEP